MTHQYKKLPVTMKMWMQFNVMLRTWRRFIMPKKLNKLITILIWIEKQSVGSLASEYVACVSYLKLTS